MFRTSKFFLHTAVFAVVIVTTSTLFPFIVGKYAWFRSAVDLAAIFFLMGIMFSSDAAIYLRRLRDLFRSPLVIAVTAFTVIFLLACFFGVRPSFSFWSNFERGEGGIQIVNLYIFFLLLATLFKEEADWRKIFWLSLAAATLMIIYGVLAGFFTHIGGWGLIGPIFGTPNYRFQGSMGNEAYVAAYLIFMMFFAAYLLLTNKKPFRSAQSLLLIATITMFLVFFVLAATRGAFLGLLAGGLAALIYLGYSRKVWRKWLAIVGVLVFVAVIVLVIFRNSPFVSHLPGSRLFSLSLQESDLTTRFIMWHVAFEGWKARPILGWGPENFLIVFQQHFDTTYFVSSQGFGAWFDRAHSVIFDYLSETGALGLLSYLSMLVCIYVAFARRRRDGESGTAADQQNTRDLWMRAFFLGLPVAYFVQALVLFDVLPIYLPLFMTLAFTVYRFRPVQPSLAHPHHEQKKAQ